MKKTLFILAAIGGNTYALPEVVVGASSLSEHMSPIGSPSFADGVSQELSPDRGSPRGEGPLTSDTVYMLVPVSAESVVQPEIIKDIDGKPVVDMTNSETLADSIAKCRSIFESDESQRKLIIKFLKCISGYYEGELTYLDGSRGGDFKTLEKAKEVLTELVSRP